jgi:signal transduction histidine kinase
VKEAIGERRLRLRDYLDAQLRPLALLICITVALTAPFAYYVLGVGALQAQAAAAAGQVADVIRSDAEQRPVLWKYDSLKLLDHLRNYELQQNVSRVEVVDARGEPIDPEARAAAATRASEPLVWQREPVMVNNVLVAESWVAMSLRELRRNTLVLLVLFGALGAALAGLTWWLPLRSMSRAELEIGALIERVETSQGELATLAGNLERQVEERSSQLSLAYHELRRKEQNLREISTRAVELQEAERRMIARDLHDAAGQTLTAIRINLELIVQALQRRPPGDAEPLVRRTATLVDETVEEIRRAVGTLGPAVIEDVGLVEAVVRLCDDVGEHTGSTVERSFELGDLELPPALETTCYRVVQEALTNVTRHARAGHIEVRLARDEDSLEIEIGDDGVGFDVQRAATGQRHGLVGMRERVELIGGRLDIDTRPGGGTHIRAVLPLRRVVAT